MRLLQTALVPATRVVAALRDPARREASAAALLAGFAVVWAAYATLSRGSRDVHHDVGELVAWSREPALGYNHPPLTAWIGRLWFSVFPLADWSAYLLATSSSALALWFAWRLFGEWLDADKRIVALAMLTLMPLTTFHALIFNANVVLLPFWAAGTLFFLRAFLRRDGVQGAFAGIAMAGAMLGKYWSVFLVAGCALAALIDPRRMAYLRSAALWASVAAGLLVLAPHLQWLLSGEAGTLSFARSIAQPDVTRFGSVEYLADMVAYAIVPLLLFALLRPSPAALADTLRPAEQDRRFAAWVLWLPLLLPPLINLLSPTRLTALWTMPNWALLPVWLLGSPLVVVALRATQRIVAVALAFPLLLLVLAPLVALVDHLQQLGGKEPYYRAVAARVDAAWHASVPTPLRLVGGDAALANGTAFYLRDRPTVLREHRLDPDQRTTLGFDGAVGARVARDGMALLCVERDTDCTAAVSQGLAGRPAQRTAFTVTRHYLGIAGRTEQFVLWVLPPAR